MINMSLDSNLNKMLSLISHEMKNPISLIKANLDLLKLSNTDFDVSKSLDMISREINELEEISHNLIETLKLENNNEKVYLLDITEDIIDSYKNVHKNIEFSIETNSDELFLFASSFHINIILKNLIKNAVEAIHQGGLSGFVKVCLMDYDDRIIIEVIDDGIGLQNNNKDKVYEKFYTTKSTGSGLGLSIVKYLLSTQDASLTLDNNLYGGCTASICFNLSN